MKEQILKIATEVAKGDKSPELAQHELLNLFSVSTRTCSDALTTIIKWNEHDKNGTDNRAPHKDECIGVICKTTLEALKGYGC